MMITCPHHGSQHGVHVSPDVLTMIADGHQLEHIVMLEYEYCGEVAGMYYFSAAYAAEYGIVEHTRHMLPDEYPDYVLATKPLCQQCFQHAWNDDRNTA